MAALGFVDVTAMPFNADRHGKKDSTRAIQSAVNFARDNQMVCFFPSGKYLVSDTISCIQNRYRNSNGKIQPGRHFPCLLVGSRQGIRPEIVLSPDSPGFQDPSKLRYLIHFWARSRKSPNTPQANISFNQMLVNLNLTIGKGNPGAVAIRHRGAQGSAIQECTINAGNALTAIEGGCGSGGSFTDITIIGGKTGMDLRETQPAPTITGITLREQKNIAILYRGRQTLTAVGIKIVASTKGPAIVGESVRWSPFHGQISLVDSQIVFNSPAETAISSKSSIFMHNVFIKGVKKIILNSDGYSIPGSVDNWLHIREFAHAVTPRQWRGYQFNMPIYVDGKKFFTDILATISGTKPPEDLQTRHLWKMNFPDWQSPEAVNVKAAPYSAKGDGINDDTKAIQKAVNQNKLLFIPKGYYKITDTITLKPDTKIIGAGRHLSVLMAGKSSLNSVAAPFPIIETANKRDADTTLAFLGFYIPKDLLNRYYMLNWQCGGNSVLRAVNFWTNPCHKRYRDYKVNHPLVIISNNGGGKWYNFFQEDRGKYQGKAYRHLAIKNGMGPLSIYQCNPEHASAESNMEINGYRFVSIYGLKGEKPVPIITIKDSDHIFVYGYGGNASASENGSIFKIINTPNYLIANTVDTPLIEKNRARPNKWHMLIEHGQPHETLKTLPLERPLLFKRGQPEISRNF